MKVLKYWLEAMRLRTLPVSVAGVIMACGFSVADGTFKPAVAAICLVFAVLCQIASNFANEYYDFKAARDRRGRQGPRRGVTEGEITPAAMKRATYGTLCAAALLGLSLAWHAGWWLIGIGAIIGIGALAYSAGPYPLSTHRLGEAAVIIFFGIVPVNLTYYVQALSWSSQVFAASCAIGLMGANVLIINNYRDIPDDIAAGKHTLATTFGRRAMTGLYIINSLAAVSLTLGAWTAAPPAWLCVPCIYIWSIPAIAIAMGKRSGASLTPLLGATAMSMFLYSLLFLLSRAI